jgi:tetraether lipid synthase
MRKGLNERNSRPFSTLLSRTAGVAWEATRAVNRLLPEGKLPSPAWAPGRLQKTRERSSPPFGIPRETESLCPNCNLDVRKPILSGQEPIEKLRKEPGLIKATIVEERGRILMRKTCKKHGAFEDVLSTNPKLFLRLESLYRGRDFTCSGDDLVHQHGVFNITSGRGSFLVVDLTNRCNMKCYPCFMNANQVGYVHELPLTDVKAIFERASSFKPRREINVLFSGGEPTASPIFIDAIRCARSLGFKRLHVATNGIRFAQDREYVQEAREAGLQAVYLQFDGASEEKNRHRGVGNLLEVKLRALENIAHAGMRAILQSTVINTVNNDGVGSIAEFAIRNIDKVHGVAFQPLMFAGRDQNVSPQVRARLRYPLTQLAKDLRLQCARDWEPMRDWFPVSYCDGISRFIDAMDGVNAGEGSLSFDDHPNWSMSSLLLVNRQTKEWLPLSSFFDIEQFIRDLDVISDSGRGMLFSAPQLRLAFLRNFNWQKAPRGLSPSDLIPLFRQASARYSSGDSDWANKAYDEDRWALLILNGMWFQDLYNFDFQANQMRTAVVGYQQGEISFDAYNAAGWRDVVEHLYSRTLSEWHREHGRHEIFAGGKTVPLEAELLGLDKAEVPA